MVVLVSIIQAILQAIWEILPLSLTAHSSMFHDFAGRFDGSPSVVTGVIHIGIALGIFASMYKLFIKLSIEFGKCAVDVVHKNLKGTSKNPVRNFLYMIMLSYVPLILWLIPCGKSGLFFTVLRKTQYNSTLLEDGIFLAIFGLIVVLTSRQLNLSRNDKALSLIPVIVVSVLTVFFVPVSGFSLVCGVLMVLLLMGVSKKLSIRFALVHSFIIFLIMGIVEICLHGEKAGIVSIILALIISAVVTYFAISVLRWLIKENYIKYLGIYDIGAGAIIAVIGIFELALR